ncbi:MAG: hypothetical protein ABH832_01905 [bacterium]
MFDIKPDECSLVVGPVPVASPAKCVLEQKGCKGAANVFVIGLTETLPCCENFLCFKMASNRAWPQKKSKEDAGGASFWL